jgi:hypothetical protein
MDKNVSNAEVGLEFSPMPRYGDGLNDIPMPIKKLSGAKGLSNREGVGVFESDFVSLGDVDKVDSDVSTFWSPMTRDSSSENLLYSFHSKALEGEISSSDRKLSSSSFGGLHAGDSVAAAHGTTSEHLPVVSSVRSLFRRASVDTPTRVFGLRPETVDLVKCLSEQGTDGRWKPVDDRVKKAKESLCRDLGIPNPSSLHLFISEQGSALSVHEGDEVIEGYLLLRGPERAVHHISFEVFVATNTVWIDGEACAPHETYQRITLLQTSLTQLRSVEKQDEMISRRAQAIFFKGVCDENGQHVVVARNYLSPRDFHVYVGPSDALSPLALESSRDGLTQNLGILLKGRAVVGGASCLVLIPPLGAPLLPSLNGKALRAEIVSREEFIPLTAIA